MSQPRTDGNGVRPSGWTRTGIHRLNRGLILAIFIGFLATVLVHPVGVVVPVLLLLVRTWLMFLGTVMAHEGSHGLLGATRAANQRWGRLALVPSMVPYVNFRKTHQLHHRYTNIPDRDPDYFLRPRRPYEIPLRAVAMPHHWYFWLRARGRIGRSDRLEILYNYAIIGMVYAALALVSGAWHVATCMVPALVLVSLLLWYPFAIKTHEGWSTGAAEKRSHNYHGRLPFWFSLGLSMHRAHHHDPRLAWIELLPLVEPSPAGGLLGLLPGRDIRA